MNMYVLISLFTYIHGYIDIFIQNQGTEFRVWCATFRTLRLPTSSRAPSSPSTAARHPTPYTYTLLPSPYTLQLTPYSLHPTPHTLRTTPYTLHPTP